MTTMTRLTAGDLYKLFPAIYQLRDAERGSPLLALARVLAEQGAIVEDDIAKLYENWFIETCDEWVVPYIGEQVGVRGLRDLGDDLPFSRRALVANTIGYRRRKGTARVIEQLAFDTTGWRAIAVEFFERLGWSQHVNHVRPGSGGTASVARAEQLEHTGGPFDVLARTVDVRRIETGRGRYNIPNIGVFLWRLEAHRMIRAELRDAGVPGGWHVHPFGVGTALFNPPQSDTGVDERTRERQAPVPLRRRPLHDELEARRHALANGIDPPHYWFDTRPIRRSEMPFEVVLDGVTVPPDRVRVCDLSNWTQPPDSADYVRQEPDGTTSVVSLPIDAAVDPVLGRVALAPASTATDVRLTYSYGAVADIGGGPYDRRGSAAAVMDRPVTWQLGVSREEPGSSEIVATLTEAIAAWNVQPAGSVGLIAIMDNSTYVEALTGGDAILVPEGSRLIVIAADWPALPVPNGLPGEVARTLGRIDPTGRRPHLRGAIDVTGTAPADSETAGELILNGITIEGQIRALGGNLGRLHVAHSTILGGTPALAVVAGNAGLQMILERVVSGPVAVTVAVDDIRILETILLGTPGLDAPASPVTVIRSTIVGDTSVLRIEASDSIFDGALVAARRQEGCVRFSWLGLGSDTPRRYRCQPDLALADAPNSEHDSIRARLAPPYTSVVDGHAAFGQLASSVAIELATGAEDGSEMGAFSHLRQPQRLANFHSQLPDYLRFGLEAGVIYAS
jgi:hypothetical protein